MRAGISLPDSTCINEIRIARKNVASIPVRKCSFAPDQRRLLGKPFREGGFVPIFGGPGCVFLMATKRQETNISKKLPAGVNLTVEDDLGTFSDLPDEIARRFMFKLIQKAAEPLGFYRGDGWQLFSLATKFQNGFDTVNIDIRAEQDYYGIYLDPTILVLLPLTEVNQDQLHLDRPLIRIVLPSDEQKMEQWNHSCHPGWVGLFVGIRDDVAKSSEPLAPEDTVLLKRTRQVKEELEYPAFALRVIATREEIGALGLTKKQRRETQPLPYFRLGRTKEWANQLFPNDTLTINDRQISVENRIVTFQKPSCYPRRDGWPYLWYPETKLLFNRAGNKTHISQIKGLKIHGPFDQDSQPRPFRQMHPYLIVPNDSRLLQLTARFFQLLANGYQKRIEADFPDDGFEGISPTATFRTEFIPPNDEDIVTANGAVIDYEEAAKEILRRWTINENRSNNRIVVVVVPDLYEGDEETDPEDPYMGLKKIFIERGLPSQMIETHSLGGVDDTSVPFGHLLWTFALNLYVKMGGRPWTLLRPMGNVNCLIGIGFGRDRQAVENPIYVGVANVFDEGGQWLSLASENRELNNEDLLSIENREYSVTGTNSYKLHLELTRKIVGNSLSVYATPLPSRTATRVVLHKNGRVYESEARGFLQAFSESIQDGSSNLSTAKFALVSIYKNHNLRMYGPDYPNLKWPMRNTVTRGSVYILNENAALVSTTGKTGYSYPGIGTPRPILIERFVPSIETLNFTGFSASQMYSIEEICEHVLALTKLHWGTTRDIRLPITSEYAQRIAGFVAKSRIRVDSLLQWKKLWWI
jgi:hypothetical protein